MIRNIVKHNAGILQAFVIWCGAAQPGWSQIVKSSEPKLSNGQRLVLLENERVQVAVIPDLGGRVLRYVDKATGRNHIWEANPLGAAGVWDKEGSGPLLICRATRFSTN